MIANAPLKTTSNIQRLNAKQTIYNVDYCAILSKNPLLEFHIEQKLWSSLFASNDNKSNVREIKAQLLMFRVRIGRKDIR